MRKKQGPLLTQRDIVVLQWIGEQYAASLDQVQRLLGRMPGKETKHIGVVTLATAERRVKRWMELDLVEREKKFMNEPAWVWLTRTGLSLLDGEYRYLNPSLNTRLHRYWVNQTRLFTEAYYAEKSIPIQWRSERMLRNEWGRDETMKNRHVPDAEIVTPEEVVALEVELTQKTMSRLREILQELAERYSRVLYFANNGTESFLTGQITTLADVEQQKFEVYPLEETVS